MVKGIPKNLAKAALLKVMRVIETHCDYYVARSNTFHPLVNPIIGIRTSSSCKADAGEVWTYGLDKVQHGVTQLISQEVYRQNIEGAIAELGVFRGVNASVMNHFFPDRPLYLFDTFEGFDRRDLQAEARLGSAARRYHDFTDTNVDVVMSRMPHGANVIVRPGWFPESAAGLEAQRFCFVVLDADLYQPLYEGLRWFYPRLANGGYIVVDDVNWADYPGARSAVHDFSREAGVSYVPIPNTTGSVVIAKPFNLTE